MYSKHIVLYGVDEDQLKVQLCELPQNSLPRAFTTIISYVTPKIQNMEIYATSEPMYEMAPEIFTVMVAHSPFNTFTKGVVRVYNFPIDISERNVHRESPPAVFTFATPPSASMEPMCLGRTGLRAVWLEHQWNTDEYRLMKGSFPCKGQGAESEPHVVLLQRAELALPFEPHHCRSLALDEATGRVWVGVHTGEVYILEF